MSNDTMREALDRASAALKPFAQTGWLTADTEHTARTVVAHMHPEHQYEIILSSDDFRRAREVADELRRMGAKDGE